MYVTVNLCNETFCVMTKYFQSFREIPKQLKHFMKYEVQSYTDCVNYVIVQAILVIIYFKHFTDRMSIFFLEDAI